MTKTAGKKPYEKPRIESDHIFEAMALICAKCQKGTCDANQKCSFNPGCFSRRL
ncbi:MAG: hypothetical protein HYU64_09330 [Armatimonadetes bacterium]|nr:hypothetical protein [Armatimonadota bacterium]